MEVEENMVFTITPILTGVRNPDQGIMTYQQGYGKRIWLPIWAFLVEGQGHTILVDTGLDENEFFIPEAFIDETGMRAVTLVEGVEQQGLSPAQVDMVINTHLHDDHCGNNECFPDAKFFAHRDEVAFCLSPHPLDHRYDPSFIETQDFIHVEDGQEILPGLQILYSPGHTPGCLSVKVETASGPTVITGFCCNRENFPPSGPAICPGVHLDAIAAWESIQRIKDLGIPIITMHDCRPV
jgi:glyoxylase-like metal-dependent hydrolase (beta-lactamase superfamily II)